MDKEQGLKAPESERKELREMSREVLYLAEQCSEYGMRVLPGKKWGLHYPEGGARRVEALARLRRGEVSAKEVVEDLKPDAVIFDAGEIREQGAESVGAKIRDISGRLQHHDYAALAEFASECPEEVPIEQIQSLFEPISHPRVQKKMHDAFGMTGKRSIELALRTEAEEAGLNFDNLTSDQKISAALKANWLAERRNLVSPESRDEILSKLTPEEVAAYEEARTDFAEYAEYGDKNAFKALVSRAAERLTAKRQEKEEAAQKEEELRLELEALKDTVPLPGMPGDPAIPPQDQDEYHTPPPESGETGEKVPVRPIFEIAPAGTSRTPLTGCFCSGRKSYYDIPTKTWSKRKQVGPYSETLDGEERQTISGHFTGGIISIPLPNGYALDASSFQSGGGTARLGRDQNGCFYIESDSGGEFSVDFLREKPAFDSQPIVEDSSPIFEGSYSEETEDFLSSLNGSDLERAMRIAYYVKRNHFYPGGGDLKMAGALQYKLRNESTPENYIPNLENSEYLECYSANTLFVSMLRRMGIPSRLVNGHNVSKVVSGKSIIDETTGHAWSEVWDGIAWRRIDATPAAKKGEEKPEGEAEGEEQTDESGEKAEDGGLETPTPPQEGESEDQSQQMQQASDQEAEEASKQLDQAQKEMEQMKQESQELREQIQKAESLDEMQQLKDKLEESELLDDMKKSLEDKLEAKEEQIKKELKDELKEMADDGFIDDESLDKLEEALEENDSQKIDQIMRELQHERELHERYEALKAEVMPYVNKWLKYFVEKLPRETDIFVDEDSRTRQGSFDKRAVMRPRNLMFGTIKNPRIISSSVKPRFISSIMVDVSGSMKGEKLDNATKLLVFYNELFSAISKEFGYLRFSINIFSDSLTEIKGYDQDYDSRRRYEFADSTKSTVKHRLMTKVASAGGTDMLPAIQKAARDLNKESFDYPDHVTAFYFLGDGGDTSGNAVKIREFMALNDQHKGFGDHLVSATLLGNESERAELANLFGDERTTVAPNFEQLVNESVTKFARDIGSYTDKKVA